MNIVLAAKKVVQLLQNFLGRGYMWHKSCKNF